jgi:hypothetical protein
MPSYNASCVSAPVSANELPFCLTYTRRLPEARVDSGLGAERFSTVANGGPALARGWTPTTPHRLSPARVPLCKRRVREGSETEPFALLAGQEGHWRPTALVNFGADQG